MVSNVEKDREWIAWSSFLSLVSSPTARASLVDDIVSEWEYEGSDADVSSLDEVVFGTEEAPSEVSSLTEVDGEDMVLYSRVSFRSGNLCTARMMLRSLWTT